MSNTNGSLLAYLASRLTGRTEVLATEALGYILSYSVAARAALSDAVRTETDAKDLIESVKTEVTGEEGERVDLVGFDKQGSERVLIEAKFWAGLTEHQPNTYIERLRRVSDEFEPDIPRRLPSLQKLINDATERACRAGSPTPRA